MNFVYGTLSMTCDECGVKIDFKADDAHFKNITGNTEGKMGPEKNYSWEHTFDCHCGNEIDITYSIQENPPGTLHHDEVRISGATETERFGYDFFSESKDDFDSDDFS